MQCNIDARGRAARLIGGIVILLAGLALLGFRGFGIVVGAWPWWVGAAGVLFGGFGIYEARAGWCAVRAMGFRTPL